MFFPCFCSPSPFTSYALIELISDVKKQLERLDEPQEVKDRIAKETQFAIFVVHNKLKEKAAEIPEGVAYFSGLDIPDSWVDYPWEMTDILEHDELKKQDDVWTAEQKKDASA